MKKNVKEFYKIEILFMLGEPLSNKTILKLAIKYYLPFLMVHLLFNFQMMNEQEV